MSKIALSEFNSLPELQAVELLATFNSSDRWVKLACAARPYATLSAMKSKAEEIWSGLSERDWLDAFEGHPRIGDVESLKKKFAATKSTAQGEQSGAAVADERLLLELKNKNEEYANKFGFIFIVFATGKSAAEMLEILNARLPNTKEVEMKNAAVEQNKITLLRIEKAIE